MSKDVDTQIESQIRRDKLLGHMRHSPRGFHAADMHKAAEELRMEGKGSEDPMYEHSKKNK